MKHQQNAAELRKTLRGEGACPIQIQRHIDLSRQRILWGLGVYSERERRRLSLTDFSILTNANISRASVVLDDEVCFSSLSSKVILRHVRIGPYITVLGIYVRDS